MYAVGTYLHVSIIFQKNIIAQIVRHVIKPNIPLLILLLRKNRLLSYQLIKILTILLSKNEIIFYDIGLYFFMNIVDLTLNIP